MNLLDNNKSRKLCGIRNPYMVKMTFSVRIHHMNYVGIFFLFFVHIHCVKWDLAGGGIL